MINTIDINKNMTTEDGFQIRRCAVENNVAMFTSLETVKVLLDVLLPPLGEGEGPPRQPEPLQPIPDRQGQGAQAPAEPRQKRQKRPKMMPDGTPYDSPASSGRPSLQGGQKGSGRTPPVRGETPEMNTVINEAAAEFGVDPDFVRAVIKQESGWKPRAVSHTGAQELMQLMLQTTRGLGIKNSSQ